MKNKKILARIFALTMTVALVFALSIPCFADTPDNQYQSVLSAFNNYLPSSMNNHIYQEFLSVYGEGVFSYDVLVSGTVTKNTVDTGIAALRIYSGSFLCQGFGYVKVLGNDAQTFVLPIDTSALLTFAFVDGEETLVAIQIESQGAFTVTLFYSLTHDSSDSSIMLTLAEVRINNATIRADLIEELQIGFVSNDPNLKTMNTIPLVLFGDSTVAHPKEFYEGYTFPRIEGVIPPLRTGMFGELYYILGDAIYGSTVGLGSAQEFALTLVATILTFATILLPILIVIGIVVWCFKRF